MKTYDCCLPKVSSEIYKETLVAFYEEKHFKDQRLGQFFMKTLWPTHVCPGLFYEENNDQAKLWVWTNLVAHEAQPHTGRT